MSDIGQAARHHKIANPARAELQMLPQGNVKFGNQRRAGGVVVKAVMVGRGGNQKAAPT